LDGPGSASIDHLRTENCYSGGYSICQGYAFQFALQLYKEIGFYLAHQLNWIDFREPGYLWQLDIPFVWGPVEGMGYFPYRFLPVVGMKGAVYSLAFNCMNFLHR
jgi:hypothetical protein